MTNYVMYYILSNYVPMCSVIELNRASNGDTKHYSRCNSTLIHTVPTRLAGNPLRENSQQLATLLLYFSEGRTKKKN